jgi:hypothetical protein
MADVDGTSAGDSAGDGTVLPFEAMEGLAKNTTSNLDMGRKTFAKFAAEQGSGTKTLDELTFEECSSAPTMETLFGQFATFLLTSKKARDRNLAVNTILQYFSAAFSYLQKSIPKKFKKEVPRSCKPPTDVDNWVSAALLIWVGRLMMLNISLLDCQWYKQLFLQLKYVATAEVVFRGENISDKIAGINRHELLLICRYLLQKGDVTAMEHRAIFLMLYHSVGRASEAATTNFNLLNWNAERELLCSGWNQTKTGRGSSLTFTSDSSNFEVDVIHALAMHIVAAGRKLMPVLTEDSEGNVANGMVWLFPGYADMKCGSCARKITSILKQLEKEKVTTDSWSSHGFRVGATDDLAFDVNVPYLAIVARADWYEKGECSIYHYISRNKLVTQAGKLILCCAVGNWPSRCSKPFLR